MKLSACKRNETRPCSRTYVDWCLRRPRDVRTSKWHPSTNARSHRTGRRRGDPEPSHGAAVIVSLPLRQLLVSSVHDVSIHSYQLELEMARQLTYHTLGQQAQRPEVPADLLDRPSTITSCSLTEDAKTGSCRELRLDLTAEYSSVVGERNGRVFGRPREDYDDLYQVLESVVLRGRRAHLVHLPPLHSRRHGRSRRPARALYRVAVRGKAVAPTKLVMTDGWEGTSRMGLSNRIASMAL